MTHLSASQVLLYQADEGKRGGDYLLGLKQKSTSDSLMAGTAVHLYYAKRNHNEAHEVLSQAANPEKAVAKYDVAVANIDAMKIPVPEVAEQYVEFKLFGTPFVGYIDGLIGDTIYELKTVGDYLSKPDASPKFGQAVNNYHKYEFQVWCYMKALNKTEAVVMEVMTKAFKTKTVHGQLIHFKLADIDERLTATYGPIIESMRDLRMKFARMKDSTDWLF